MADRPDQLRAWLFLTSLISEYGTLIVGLAFAVMFFAGFTKGAVGFALPMISVSGIGSLMSAEVAIAALILPGLVTNLMQSLRNGIVAALGSLLKYWRINLSLFVLIGLCAQLIVVLPEAAIFSILGVVVSAFGLVQLLGWKPRYRKENEGLIEWVVGLVAGFLGGLAGVWGPPILMYLLARDVPKIEIVRVQGIAFLIGSIVLTAAHLYSGVLNTVTIPFSSWLILPAVAGMWLGQRLQDRLPQAEFRKLVLFVLILAGLNLLRRGVL